MEHQLHEASLLPGELGLLTVAERRGVVRLPRTVDDRCDVATLERMALIDRLLDRGLMAENSSPDNPEERVFEISEEGRKALSESDQPAPPPARGARA